jgi:hypothetical protein
MADAENIISAAKTLIDLLDTKLSEARVTTLMDNNDLGAYQEAKELYGRKGAEIAENIISLKNLTDSMSNNKSTVYVTASKYYTRLLAIQSGWVKIVEKYNKLEEKQKSEVLKKLEPITDLSNDTVGKNLTITAPMKSAMDAFIQADVVTTKALEGNTNLKKYIVEATQALKEIKDFNLHQTIQFWEDAVNAVTMPGTGDAKATAALANYSANRAAIISSIDELKKLNSQKTDITRALKVNPAEIVSGINALESQYNDARIKIDQLSDKARGQENIKFVISLIDFYDKERNTPSFEKLSMFKANVGIIKSNLAQAIRSGVKTQEREKFDTLSTPEKVNYALQNEKNKLGVSFEEAIKDAKLYDWQKKELVTAIQGGLAPEAISNMVSDMQKDNKYIEDNKRVVISELAETYKFLYRDDKNAPSADEISKLPNANERFQEFIDFKRNANRAEVAYKKQTPERVTALQESFKENVANMKKVIEAEVRKATIKQQQKAMDKLAGEMRKASPEKPIQRDATGKRIFTPNNNAEIKQQDVLAQDGKTVKKIASYATEDGSVTTIAPDASLTNFATTKSQMKQDLSDMAKAVANFLPNYEKELGFSQEQKDRLLEEYKIASDYFAKMQQAYVENNANDKDGFYHYMRLLEKQLLKKKEADTALKSEEEDTLKQVQTYENAINGLIANLKLTVAGKSSSYQDLVTNAINQMLELQKDFTEANRVKVKEIYDATISQGNIILGTKASVVNEITNMMMVLSEKSRASVNGYQKNELLGVIAQLTNLKDSLDIDKARALFNQYKDVQPIVSDVAVQPPVPAVNTPADNKS